MITLFMVVFVFIMLILVASSGDSYKNVYGTRDSNNKLLSITVTGVILGDKATDESGGGLFDTGANTYGYEIKKQIALAAKDESIKGIVLEINSPGGTIFGAKAIADAVEAYKQQTHNPVIVHVNGIAASGAYWAAASADSIMADAGTEVGSIGVIFGPFQYYDKVTSIDNGILGGGVVTQNGIDEFYITAGKSKDFGNPFRKLTTDELTSTQTMVNNEYEEFVNHVTQTRHIPADTIKNKLGAMVYETKRAKELGLIDSTGSIEDSYVFLANLAHLKRGEYEVVRQRKSSPAFADTLDSLGFIRHEPQVLSLCKSPQVVLSYYGNVMDLCGK
jgi:protease-4